jgi:DNA polymerase III alpha subunit
MNEERRKSYLKYVSLHSHTNGSIYDGLGYPEEHMDFAYSNGSDALALTDHGHQNGLSYQVLHAQKMHKEGKKFKPIFGVEAYFHHSIKEWQDEKSKSVVDKRKSKKEEEVSGVTIESEQRNIKNVLNI